uniref:ABC transporter family protein n=1 Tax=Rhizophora mucronata TaxID=61149 RepID=A0A2P2LHF0_RHIMU
MIGALWSIWRAALHLPMILTSFMLPWLSCIVVRVQRLSIQLCRIGILVMRKEEAGFITLLQSEDFVLGIGLKYLGLK